MINNKFSTYSKDNYYVPMQEYGVQECKVQECQQERRAESSAIALTTNTADDSSNVLIEKQNICSDKYFTPTNNIHLLHNISRQESLQEPLQETARRYRDAGLCVLPIRADGSKEPFVSRLPRADNGDRRWTILQKRLPTNTELKTFFQSLCGIAIIGGAISGNLEILDFDDFKKYQEFIELCRTHGLSDLIATLVLIETPSGCYHLYYRCVDPIESSQKLASRLVEVPEGTHGATCIEGRWCKVETLIETRGEAAYVLAPPSPPECHEAKKPYLLIRGKLTDIPAITPEERNAMLNVARALNEYAPAHLIKEWHPGTKLSGGNNEIDNRNTRAGDDYNRRGDIHPILEKHGWTLSGMSGQTVLWKRPGKLAPGVSATSNYAGTGLFYVFSTNAFPFEPNLGYKPFAIYTLLEHNGDFKAAAKALAKKGYGTEYKSAKARQKTRSELIAPACGSPTSDSPTPDSAVTNFELNEFGNMERFVHYYGENFRFCNGNWMHYDGARWIVDITGEVNRSAVETVRRIIVEAHNCQEEGRRTDLLKHAARSTSNAKVKALIELAQTHKSIAVSPQDFDSDSWLYNTQNHVIDLRTGQPIERSRSLLLTKMAHIAYDPQAGCPTFYSFLERVVPDPADRKFLQFSVGYTLTGETKEHALFFLSGDGSNGKSTLINIIEQLMGDYAHKSRAETFMETSRKAGAGSASPHLLALKGKRLITVSEIGEGDRLNESLIKDMTGDDAIVSRGLYEKYETVFQPTFKVWMYGNHKPNIQGQDEGIWRRVHIIPFNVFIPKEDRNHNLRSELQAEMPGILNWALEGCLLWQKHRLPVTNNIHTATDQYRNEMNVLLPFIEECCIIDASSSIPLNDIHQAYRAWCFESGEKPLGKINFRSRLEKMGYAAASSGANIRVQTGIRLHQD